MLMKGLNKIECENLRGAGLIGRVIPFDKLLALLMLLTSASVFAYDFKSDVLCYNILSEEDRTVKVTYLYYNPNNIDYVSGVLEIPEKVVYENKTYSVTAIGESAFSRCERLTSVTIPNSVTSIEKDAFGFCAGLTSVTIPNSVISIENDAFRSCIGLTSVAIGNSVTSIGDRTFFQCSGLESINVDTGNQYYSSIDGILYNKDASFLILCPVLKESVTIPNSVTSIGDQAFENCRSLMSVIIPNSVTSIGNQAFSRCSGMTSLTIGNSVIYIGDRAFEYCRGLTSITIGESVASIGSYAFFGCFGLKSVIIPNSVTTIGDHAFSRCTGLTTATIGNSVTSIGDNAFEFCNMRRIYCQAVTPPDTSNNIFSETTLKGWLYVPAGCKSVYEAVEPWRNFEHITEMESSAIDAISSDYGDFRISVENGTLLVDGIDGNELVTIYDIQGRMVYNGIEHSITNLPSGIYIVKIGSRAAKFTI